MSQPVDIPAGTRHPLPHSDTHLRAVQRTIPDWLVSASPDVHTALRQAGGASLPWFENARQTMPAVCEALKQTVARHRRNEQALGAALAELPSLEVFAQPLLTTAIQQRFGLEVDVHKTWLFHASRARAEDGFEHASKDPLVQLQLSLKAATQTLLHAALQNFEAWETEPGAMDLDNVQKAAVYGSYPVSAVSVSGTPLAIEPVAFAALCRELDLGGRYQRMIDAFLNPASSPEDAPDAAAFNRRGLFKRVEESTLSLQLHIAYMKHDISESLYNATLEVARNRTGVQVHGEAVVCSSLRLWDIELTGIVVIGKDRQEADQVQPVVVYIPGDPVCALKEYASGAAFTQALRDRLLMDGYLSFFQRFIAARHRSELLAKLEECLRPNTWNPQMGWYERQVDPNATLHLRDMALAGGWLTMVTERKAAMLKDDALFHAVPTAVEDQKTAAQRLRYFENIALQVLNLVGFFVPQVGAVMMAVTAAQLTAEVFEGIDSWTRGEQEQGWRYLMDVAENMALMAALSAAHQGSETPALEKITVQTPSFIEELHEVELPDGQKRLWKADLAPFAHDTVLPAGLAPDEFGLYHYQDKTWVSIEDQLYSIKQNAGEAHFRARHPTKTLSYEPSLQHNGAGAWLHPADQPIEWEGLKLFRRLGHSASRFSDVTSRRILLVSDTHEAVLRRTLIENQRPPALLLDTMLRFDLDQQIQAEGFAPGVNDGAGFDALYRETAPVHDAHATPIIRDYPDLPAVIANEVVGHASVAEQAQLAEGRVPLRQAEEIRVYQQQVRLTRAYEGLYLDSVNNPDTHALILHTLETLPGWPADMRLEVREGRVQGTLIDAVGPADATVRKILVRYTDGFEAFDDQAHALHGRDDFYASVGHACLAR